MPKAGFVGGHFFIRTNIKAETVGEYKIEYASANTLSSDKKDGLMASLIDERIREAFVHTGLMYRGIYEN